MIAVAMSGAGAIWCAIVFVVAVDAIWMRVAGISADPAGIGVVGFAVGSLVAVALFYYRTGRADPLMRAANAAAQLVSFTAAAAALSYLVTATNTPLVDTTFATADRAIGFDWQSWFVWVQAHPMVHLTFVLAYGSLLYQMVGCVLFLALRKTADEFLSILVVSGLLTIAISGFLPAMGKLADAPHIPHFVASGQGRCTLFHLAEDLRD
jgi:PAP2 superfamily